jgi:hypothetical protein
LAPWRRARTGTPGHGLEIASVSGKARCCASLQDIIDNIARTATGGATIFGKIQEIRAFGCGGGVVRPTDY